MRLLFGMMNERIFTRIILIFKVHENLLIKYVQSWDIEIFWVKSKHPQ